MRIWREEQLDEAVKEITDAIRAGFVVTYQVTWETS
jgi:hypothetical protein